MSMIDMGTDSFPILAILISLMDEACAGFKIGSPLNQINTLSIGGNILTTKSKERSGCGHGLSIVSYTIYQVSEGNQADYV